MNSENQQLLSLPSIVIDCSSVLCNDWLEWKYLTRTHLHSDCIPNLEQFSSHLSLTIILYLQTLCAAWEIGATSKPEVWLLEELTRREYNFKISCNIVLRCEMTKHFSRSEIWLPKNSSDNYITEKPVSSRRISKYGLSYFNINSYALAWKFSKQCLKCPKHRSEKDSNLRIQSVSCLLNGQISKAMSVTVRSLFIIFNYCYYLSLSWHSW